MKTLYLLRHAKSSWESPSVTDFDRPLNERGYADAHLTGNYLHAKKIEIDLVISSPAIRAMSTAIIISRHLEYAVDNILIRQELYDSSVKDYLKCIAGIESGDSILLTGHNNTISEIAQKLSIQRVNELKTCAVICIRFAFNSWAEILSSKGDLLFEIHPSLIKAM
jgi:phosphohistidine phosphatase